METEEIKIFIKQQIGEPILPWEQEYLNFHAARFADTLKLLGPGQGSHLLDVGAFPGHLTVAVQNLGYQVQALTGVNESVRGLECFINRMGRHHIPVALTDVELEAFPYPDKTFDVVLAAEIIEHLPFNPYRILREAFRVLKPGGRILLSTPNIAKLDNVMGLAFGSSIHPDIRLPFHKTFKSILIGRHIREYAAAELIYMLEEQNKEMYRFENSKVSYSMCLDPAWSWWESLPWAFKKIWPRARAGLFLQAYRPRNLELFNPEGLPTKGFYEVEEHKADMGSTGRLLSTPFRWTQDRAEIDLPASKARYQVFFLHLIFLAPKYLPPAVLNLTIGDIRINRVGLPPDREYALLRLVLPAHLAQEGFFKVSLTSSIWRPGEHVRGINYYEFSTEDRRELGIAIGWDGFMRQDCDNIGELRDLARRECRASWLYPRERENWSALTGLYLIHTKMKPSLAMGPGDWRQLGQGWYHLERWKQGWIRWSSRRSEVYLEPKGPAHHLHLEFYTGDKALGPEVKGLLEVEGASDRITFLPLAKQSFALPADQWTELDINLPAPVPSGGLLRLTFVTASTRVPALLMAGSRDERELGVAVSRVSLK